MRLFASDPTLTYKVPASTGIHRVTALDIQWSYLRAIEGSKLSNYPEWAPMLLQRWRRTLECLQNVGAAALSTSLDWPIKAQVYADFCDQFGIPWDKLADWNAFMEKLANSYRRVGSAMPRTLSSAVIFDAQSPVRGNRTLTTHLRKHDLNPDRLTDLQMLRNKLFEIETKYLHVGGIFEQLESAGVLDDEASLNRKAVAEATANPPHGTRAKVRGECVAELSGSKNVTCDWCGVIDRDKGRAISLDDPLAATAVWQDHKGSSGLSNEESPLGLRIDALSCYRDGEHEEARAILQSLLRIGFELPSTHCHLARVELITDNFALAAEHTEQAWALRGQAPAYVVPRIIWLQMANAMLQAHARPLTPLIGKMKTALQQTEPYEWTMTPVLDHLRAMLTDRNFNLLAMLSAVISGESAVSALESQPDWRMAAAEPVT